MKETRRKKYSANHAEDQITQLQRWPWTGHRVTLAIATVAGLALASGCATRHQTSACYSPPPSTAYAPTPEPTTPTATSAQATMVVPLREESVKVGTREVDAGSVRLKKIVKTETINQPVQLRREEVVIDRDTGS